MSKHDNNEHYGSGSLTQLYARGPEDRHQIGDDAIRNWYPYYSYPFIETVWNNPTRSNKYPLYGIFPYYHPYYYSYYHPYYYPYYYPASI